ncbi:GSCOCG00005131001-RA-CDS [Cotesia congregata]|uniref:Similar to TIMM29: Mitochondrial import inner membrane translocase subunit Tim29 (Homo sapiens) n=1 Tax=Cotesia congregata TaxID=51543 RepID=A0A8J2MQA1_COTCN|nr:GSCOCG00005131001-RA-CDS [Cotesia congregata]CAG5101288.1 Similar to TIMM29: Mitochondrial import inner membrane translocase subunit Tim29 (Homo sapiens) [Cotesia congregata]
MISLRCKLFKSQFSNLKVKKLSSLTQEVVEKETTLQKWGKHWKGVYQDYKDVAIDLKKNCKERPISALIKLAMMGGCYYLYRTNPDQASFKEALLQNEARLTFIGESIRNPVSVKHVEHMSECLNENIIRRLTLGLVSFIWLDNYSDSCALYKTTCTYLKPKYLEFHQRIVDVGFLGKWWVLDHKMKDYDINDSEFQ